jgi:predicted RNA-binding protein with TRAM domain
VFPVLQSELPFTLIAGGGVLVLVLLLLGRAVLGGGDGKYDDPDAQAAHEAAQARDEDEAAPVGSVQEAVVTETDDTSQGREAVVKVNGLVVFVDQDVPDTVEAGDTIQLKITSHSENAAHAMFVTKLD